MVNQRRPARPASRLLVLRVLVVLSFVVLAGQLYRLQIVQGDTYRWKANANRFREIPQPAARGVIYDRGGAILARNRPRYEVTVLPDDLPEDDLERERVLVRLHHLLETAPDPVGGPALDPAEVLTPTVQAVEDSETPSLADLRAAVAEAETFSLYQASVLLDDVPRTAALMIQEQSRELPGISIQVYPRREYPTGALTAHIIGYTGPIPAEALGSYEAQGYLQTDEIGLAGLESTFEEGLRGEPGYRAVIVDVYGREVEGVGEPQPPAPGRNLVLNIDLELQRKVEQALRTGLAASYRGAGVVVVMNPKTGAILALVSLPAYDNNLFAQGISAQAYGELSEDIDRPLVNHAISGIYPPGSIFKIIPAAAALQEETITARTKLGDSDELDGKNDGIMWLPNRYYPWDRTQDQPFYCWIHTLGYGHGRINLVTALAESCDVFFYQLTGGYRDFEGLGLEATEQYALLFGLGALSGIDLPAESVGLVPDAQWKRLTYGQSWVTGDTYNVAIGQGYVLVTPLQMLNATVAVANGGYLYRPQLVERVTDASGRTVREFPPELIRELPIAHEHLALVREGMYNAVNWEYGTAVGAALPNVSVAGKTGTAEYFTDRDEDGYSDRDAQGNLPTHAWFTAFAPYEDPEIALIVLVEGGGEGSKAAVPVAAEILSGYFAPETPEEIGEEPGGPRDEGAPGQEQPGPAEEPSPQEAEQTEAQVPTIAASESTDGQ